MVKVEMPYDYNLQLALAMSQSLNDAQAKALQTATANSLKTPRRDDVFRRQIGTAEKLSQASQEASSQKDSFKRRQAAEPTAADLAAIEQLHMEDALAASQHNQQNASTSSSRGRSKRTSAGKARVHEPQIHAPNEPLHIFQKEQGMTCYGTTSFLSASDEQLKHMFNKLFPQGTHGPIQIHGQDLITLRSAEIEATKENIDTNSLEMRKIIAADRRVNNNYRDLGSPITFLEKFFGKENVTEIGHSIPEYEFDNSKALKTLQHPAHKTANTVDLIFVQKAYGGLLGNAQGHFMAAQRLEDGRYKVINPLRENNHISPDFFKSFEDLAKDYLIQGARVRL